MGGEPAQDGVQAVGVEGSGGGLHGCSLEGNVAKGGLRILLFFLLGGLLLGFCLTCRCAGEPVLCSFGARRGGGGREAGQRLRSGAFAPDCPVVILVAARGGCLRIPSGLSTPRLPPTTAPPCSISGNLTGGGKSGVLGVPGEGGDGEEDLAGPAPGRPRGRPFGAYAVRGADGAGMGGGSLLGVGGLVRGVGIACRASCVMGLRRAHVSNFVCDSLAAAAGSRASRRAARARAPHRGDSAVRALSRRQ
ncbi:hypothetical protein HMPREF0004_0735 [Achromobacter piechaudii ATCC 43553]|uniref:Uncharacterized protein n=1 Tax=Achromobacter piechaudii ATCC 43553 TaxID=742159 RepID=D4X5I8_9BURK|nr:hypothetical protein HMPREF0004_0735 [Achromobacter piechaudii ATCC 43553]